MMRVKHTNQDKPNKAPSSLFKKPPEFIIKVLTFPLSFLPFEALWQGISAVILFLLGAATWMDTLHSV
jgi:hypothetical protein